MRIADILVYVRGVDMDSKVTICGIPHKIEIVYDGFNNNDM